VEKYPWGKGFRWRVLRDGQPFDSSRHQFITRKRDAEKAAAELAAWDEWQAHVYRDDADGSFRWTATELSQIVEYAAKLATNSMGCSFFTQLPLRTIARQQHQKDAEDLLKDDTCWTDAPWVRAEKRRVMAARLEAFRRAGLDPLQLLKPKEVAA
jgi:hypothetical protein